MVKRGHVIRDYLLYVVIAAAVVIAIATTAIYVPKEHRIPVRWVALALITPITFGYPLRWFRRYWPNKLFWVSFFGLLIIHLAAYITLLRAVDKFGLLWFAIINSLEWGVICPVLGWAGRSEVRRAGHV